MIRGVLFHNDFGNFSFRKYASEQISIGVNIHVSIWKVACSTVN
jgi:hypothetical protein